MLDAVLSCVFGVGIGAWLTLITGGALDEVMLTTCVTVLIGVAVDDDSGGEWNEAAQDMRKML